MGIQDRRIMVTVSPPPVQSLWRKIHRSPLFDITQFSILILMILWFFDSGTERLGYNWQWYQIPQYIYTHDETGYYPGPLWDGLMVTLRISGISLLLAFAIGLATALFRLSNSFVARIIARVYLEAIRNTPLLIQLFLSFEFPINIFGCRTVRIDGKLSIYCLFSHFAIS